jgi:hypothetical protein
VRAETHTEIYRPFRGRLTPKRLRAWPLAASAVRTALKSKLPLALCFVPVAITTVVYSFLVYGKYAVEDVSQEMKGLEGLAAHFAKQAIANVRVAEQIADANHTLRLFALLALFDKLGTEGVSILVSSHVLHEIEGLTQRMVLIHRGRLLAQGSVAEVRALLTRFPRRIELWARDARRLAQDVLAWPGVRSISLAEDGHGVRVETQDALEFQRRLTALAARGGYGIEGMELADASLEALFSYLVQ